MRSFCYLVIACALAVSLVRCTAGLVHADPTVAPVGTARVGDRVLAPDLSAPVVPKGDPAVAFDTEHNPFGVVSQVVRYLTHGEWRYALVVLLCAMVSALRKLHARWPWTTSDMGGAVLAFAYASSAVLGLRVLAGAPLTWGSLTTAALGGMTAMGGYAGLWVRLLRPLWRKARGDSSDWDSRTKPVPAKAGA